MTADWVGVALLTGLVGSLHCVGMCGPLAMALPVGRLSAGQRWPGIGLYHAGRVTAYSVLGMSAGTIGQGFLLLGLQRPVSIGAGLLLLGWTLFIRGRFASLNTATSARWIVKPMTTFLQSPSLPTFTGLGFLNGLLPCGFVYVALAGAIVTGNVLESGEYMALFGVGTLPALLAIRVIPTLFPVRIRRHFTRLMPVVAAGLGVLLIVRGLTIAPATNHSQQPIPLCHGNAIGIK